MPLPTAGIPLSVVVYNTDRLDMDLNNAWPPLTDFSAPSALCSLACASSSVIPPLLVYLQDQTGWSYSEIFCK
jgi:hypothetical protein